MASREHLCRKEFTSFIRRTLKKIEYEEKDEYKQRNVIGKIKIALFGEYKFPRILQKHTS